MIRALDERNAHPRPNGLGLHDHLCATALEFGRGRIHVIDTQPQMIQPDIGFRTAPWAAWRRRALRR